VNDPPTKLGESFHGGGKHRLISLQNWGGSTSRVKPRTEEKGLAYRRPYLPNQGNRLIDKNRWVYLFARKGKIFILGEAQREGSYLLRWKKDPLISGSV